MWRKEEEWAGWVVLLALLINTLRPLAFDCLGIAALFLFLFARPSGMPQGGGQGMEMNPVA